MTEKKRILYIDYAKAIAIILVVIGHYYPDSHPIWYGNMRSIIYGFHMPLFMFASGFVYIATKREIGYGIFLWRKVKRLMIPYFVVSAIIITIKMLTQGTAYVENPVTPMSYLKMLYLPEAGFFLWFIWALWWMFVIAPFFNTKWKRVLLLICAIVLYHLPVTFPDEFCLREIKKMSLFFCLGCFIGDYKNLFSRLKEIPTYVFFALFVAVNYLKIIEVPSIMGRAEMIVPIVGISFMIRFSLWIEKHQFSRMNSKILLLVAASSYIIYLLHTIFEGFAKAIIHKVPILMDANNGLMFSLGAIIIILCGIVAPIVLDKYVLRKYKLTRLLFGYN